jgi:hypothetical protein
MTANGDQDPNGGIGFASDTSGEDTSGGDARGSGDTSGDSGDISGGDTSGGDPSGGYRPTEHGPDMVEHGGHDGGEGALPAPEASMLRWLRGETRSSRCRQGSPEGS